MDVWHQVGFFSEFIQLTAVVPMVNHGGNSVKYYFEYISKTQLNLNVQK